jgi:hypothetical protein
MVENNIARYFEGAEAAAEKLFHDDKERFRMF